MESVIDPADPSVHQAGRRLFRMFGRCTAAAVVAVSLSNCANPVVAIRVMTTDSQIQINRPSTIWLDGAGYCPELTISFGDGSYTVLKDFTLKNTQPFALQHVWSGWPGRKIVAAESTSTCFGTVRSNDFVVFDGTDASTLIAFGAPTRDTPYGACGIISNKPFLRAGTTVLIESIGAPSPDKIDFGCAFGGCVYDPSGEPGSIAGSDYPAPGMRKYSLVLRDGSQLVQGSNASTTFMTQSLRTALEFCANDNNLNGNAGGWTLRATIDESTARRGTSYRLEP